MKGVAGRGDYAATRIPQALQKLAPASSAAPQREQNPGPPARRRPQVEQNTASGSAAGPWVGQTGRGTRDAGRGTPSDMQMRYQLRFTPRPAGPIGF